MFFEEVWTWSEADKSFHQMLVLGIADITVVFSNKSACDGSYYEILTSMFVKEMCGW